MSKKNYKIPFKNGTMMEYTGAPEGEHCDTSYPNYSYSYPTDWRENTIFETSVHIEGTYRGRSAARINIYSKDLNEHYSLGLDAFVEACKAFGVKNGNLKGKWTFRKQGSNYTLYPVVS